MTDWGGYGGLGPGGLPYLGDEDEAIGVIPTVRFTTLMLDPPWTESGGGKIKRGADRHYPLVKTKDMPGVIRESGLWTPAEYAHVWMWVTNNYLADGLWLLEELGATYVTNAVWVKKPAIVEAFSDAMRVAAAAKLPPGGLFRLLRKEIVRLSKPQIGLGQYLRGAHELLLFGRIGKGQHETSWGGYRDVPSVIEARRTKHSRKPEESYQLIERVSKGPRVEFFARSGREGWTSWGNEIAA